MWATGVSLTTVPYLAGILTGEVVITTSIEAPLAASPVPFLFAPTTGGTASLERAARRFASPTQPVRGSGIPGDPVRPLPRGGVMVRTSIGWIQIGVPMWTNKDAKALYDSSGGPYLRKEEIPHVMPTIYIFDLDYVPSHDGLLPADFLQYMYFITKETRYTLVASDDATAVRLEKFLDLALKGPSRWQLQRRMQREYPEGASGIPDLLSEMEEGFDAVAPELLREVVAFNEASVWERGGVVVKKRRPLQYDIYDHGELVAMIDLKNYPLTTSALAFCDTPRPGRHGAQLRRLVLREGRPALWPIGTGYGFLPREETSGFMIWNQGRCILVDPPSITLEYLAAAKIPLAAITGVILTHGHTDHYGNAIPQLLEALPQLKLYTTPTIRDILAEEHRLALAGRSVPLLSRWSFVPLLPQRYHSVLGLSFWVDYTFHSVPAIGFEIWDRPDARKGRMIVYFSGDTLIDPVAIWERTRQRTKRGGVVISEGRATDLTRFVPLLLWQEGAKPPAVALLDGGIRPLHAGPETLAELMAAFQAEGIDTRRFFSYHLSREQAAAHGLPKWKPGHPGFIDLSDYF